MELNDRGRRTIHRLTGLALVVLAAGCCIGTFAYTQSVKQRAALAFHTAADSRSAELDAIEDYSKGLTQLSEADAHKLHESAGVLQRAAEEENQNLVVANTRALLGYVWAVVPLIAGLVFFILGMR